MGCSCYQPKAGDYIQFPTSGQKNDDNNFSNIKGSRRKILESNIEVNRQRNGNKKNDCIPSQEIPKKKNQEGIYRSVIPNNFDFNISIINIFNKIRENPLSYADIVDSSIGHLKKYNNTTIYEDYIKVFIPKGETAFKEAAKILRATKPLPPFLYKSEISIQPPNNEEDINNNSYLRDQVKKIRDNNTQIDIFFKDNINIPERAALFIIVDDNGKGAGKKRNTILSRELKYIGVSSIMINNKFSSYFTFSK